MAIESLSSSTSRSSSPVRADGELARSLSPLRRDRSEPPLLRDKTQNAQRRKGKVDRVTSNLRLGGGDGNRYNTTRRKTRNWTHETPRGRTRARGRDNIRGVSVDANLRNQNLKNSTDPQIKIELKKAGSGSSDSTIKPYYIFEWMGHRYRLTHRYKEGAQIRQIGFTEKDWEALAEMQKTIWQAAHIQNPEKSNFNVEKRILNVKVQGNEGEPVTIDFKAQSPATQQTITQALESSYRKVKKHPLRFTNGNPPPPSFPGQKKKQKPASQDPINPIASVPPPEQIPWWRIDKHIANLFKKSPPQPAPVLQNLNLPNSLLPTDFQNLNLTNPELPPVPHISQILTPTNNIPNHNN